ncbi:MAG: hypothetical protein WCX64_00570 [Candidatus Micrarchaeia archaeon]
MKGQTSLEYLLILAGTVMLVLLVSTIVNSAMAPGLENARNNSTAQLWNASNDWGTPTIPSTTATPTPTVGPIEFFFQVQDNGGSSVALFLPTGDVVLKTGCYAGAAGSCANPPDGSFAVRDPAGVSHAFINPSGSLCIEDANCNGNDASCNSPPDDSFTTQNSAGTTVSYISPAGALCLTGSLVQYGNP